MAVVDEESTRVRSLCTIDGIVHRLTDEPLAGIATLVVDDRLQVGPAWALGDLDSTRNMDTLDCYEGDNGFWTMGNPRLARAARPCREGFVSLADWTAVVGAMAPVRSWADVAGMPSWPQPMDLVRLEPSYSGPTDGRPVLNAAAVLAPRVQRLSIWEANRLGLTYELAELCHGIIAMDGLETGYRFRQELLSDVETFAGCARDGLSRASDPNSVMWAYIAALALHAVRCETDDKADDDEQLVTVRL